MTLPPAGQRISDTLWGGAGKNTFVLSDISDSGVGRFNRDEVHDFSVYNGDSIADSQLFLIGAGITIDQFIL